MRTIKCPPVHDCDICGDEFQGWQDTCIICQEDNELATADRFAMADRMAAEDY